MMHRLPSGRMVGPHGRLYKVRGNAPHRFGLKHRQGRYRVRSRSAVRMSNAAAAKGSRR